MRNSAGIVKRASRAKLEGIVEEEREGRGQGEVELDARLVFRSEIARGMREREKRGATHFGCVVESFSRASSRLSPPVNPKLKRRDCPMLGPVAAMACSRFSCGTPRGACSDPRSGCGWALRPHGVV